MTKSLVGRLVLGTAAFAPSYAGQVGLTLRDMSAFIDEAEGSGIRWFDTAPTYGAAEEILGQAAAWKSCCIATKVSGALPVEDIRESLDNSRVVLRMQRLQLVQIHNATVAQLCEGSDVLTELRRQRKNGQVLFFGASVYEEDEALAAINAGCDMIQVPFNLIDQRMARRVFPAAKKAGVKVWARSIWLRGALSSSTAWLHEPKAVTDASRVVLRRMGCTYYRELTDIALRFVLSHDAVTGVVIGPRTVDELVQACQAAERGRLSSWRRFLAATLPPWPASVYDPRLWKER